MSNDVKLTVGAVVQFIDQHGEPRAAIVTDIENAEKGRVALVLFRPGSTVPVALRNILPMPTEAQLALDALSGDVSSMYRGRWRWPPRA